jgi:hypothetical protein
VAIAFNWGNSHNGQAGAITNVSSVVIGETNRATDNGATTYGDFLVAVLVLCADDDAAGSPSVDGFHTLHDLFSDLNFTIDIRVWVGYRIASEGESAAYTASWSGIADGVGWGLFNFGGVSQVNPIDNFEFGTDADGSGNHFVPSVTPTIPDAYWLAIECRGGANAPDTPSPPLIGLYDAVGNDVGARPEISVAGLQLTSASPTGIGTFTQAAFAQPSQGISIALTPARGATTDQVSGAGSISGRKRRRKKQQKVENAVAAATPRRAAYVTYQLVDSEDDEDAVLLFTVH